MTKLYLKSPLHPLTSYFFTYLLAGWYDGSHFNPFGGFIAEFLLCDSFSARFWRFVSAAVVFKKLSFVACCIYTSTFVSRSLDFFVYSGCTTW